MSTDNTVTERQAPNRWFVLVLVCLAQFMVVLDATVVNVALPAIQKGLNFTPADLPWVINAYTLTFGGFLLLGGRAGDLFGRQTIFLIGVGIFSVASLLNGLATTQAMLIATRALQGFGGAMVSPAALSIITTTFAEGAERTKALGVWSAIAAGGSAFGLIIGGVLTGAVSWQWIFFINVPVGILAFVLSLRFVPNSRAVLEHRSVDIAGALTVTVGLMLLVYSIINTAKDGWASWPTVRGGAASLGLLAIFLVIEAYSRSPLMRLSIFRVRSLASANLAMFMAAGGLFAMFYFASIYLQEILLYGPLKAGFAFLPVCVAIGVGAGLAQKAIPAVGARNVSAVGLVIASVGLLIMTTISTEAHYATTLLPGLVVMAVGMGLTFVPVTLIATTNVADEDAGLASGLLNTSQQVGGALGLSILATLAASRSANLLAGADPRNPGFPALFASAQVSGFHLAFVIGAVLMVSGAVLLTLMLRSHHLASISGDAATAAVKVA